MITALQKEINNLLQENPETKDLQIEAMDNNGVITLKGLAPSKKKSKKAEELVEAQEGVAAVINEIQVKSEEEVEEEKDTEVVVAPRVKPHQPSLVIKKEKEEE